MGLTLQQLSQTMTAQEFAQHYALELEEPMPSAAWSMGAAQLAALANGPLQRPEPGRLWCAGDFMPALWQQDGTPAPALPAKPQTVDDIMARARLAGMVQ